MSIFGDLVDLATLCDRGRAEIIKWLVTNTKTLVLLWARNLDATELRFSLLEIDSNQKTTEESTTDDDAVIRFGLLDLK